MKSWIVLPNNIFVDVICKNKVFLYNVNSSVQYVLTDPDCISIITDLRETNNLGSIEYSVKMGLNKVLRELLSLGMLEVHNTSDKPVIFLPIMNLQRDLEKGDIKKRISILGSKSRFISGINLLINLPFDIVNNDSENKRLSAIKQYFIAGGNLIQHGCMSFNMVDKVLESLKSTSIVNIDLIINLSHTSTYDINRIKYLSNKYNYIFRLHSFIDNINIDNLYRELADTENIKIYLYCDRYSNNMADIIDNHPYYANKIRVSKFIYDENDVIDSFSENMIPIYGEEGYSLFRKYVFLSEDDILNNRISMKEIMRNQKINANCFGIIDILPNGDIFPHGGIKPIGKVDTTNFLTKAVINELLENNSWRMTRNKTKCEICQYRFICPPISTIELIFANLKICKINM